MVSNSSFREQEGAEWRKCILYSEYYVARIMTVTLDDCRQSLFYIPKLERRMDTFSFRAISPHGIYSIAIDSDIIWCVRFQKFGLRIFKAYSPTVYAWIKGALLWVYQCPNWSAGTARIELQSILKYYNPLHELRLFTRCFSSWHK